MDARWSLGAGLGLGSGYYVGVGGLSPLPLPLGPLGARASLEYLLGEDLALLLNGAGTYARSTVEESGVPEQRDPDVAYGLSAGVGLRKYVAGGQATRFSVHALLSAGFARRETPNVSGLPQEERTRLGTVAVGLAVDRELLERLSVRVGAEVAGVSHVRIHSKNQLTEGEPPSEIRRNTTSASFYFAPSVELRLAF